MIRDEEGSGCCLIYGTLANSPVGSGEDYQIYDIRSAVLNVNPRLSDDKVGPQVLLWIPKVSTKLDMGSM
jgi:hypothetical protein